MTVRYLSVVLVLALSGCIYATNPVAEKEKTYAPVEASLTGINQKVTGHFLATGVPDDFDVARYRNTIEEICRSNPSCLDQTEAVFSSYGVNVRKVDEMFTVMLCDRQMQQKIMEDFSCNNLRVEVRNWKSPDNAACEFEPDWQAIEKEYCGD